MTPNQVTLAAEASKIAYIGGNTTRITAVSDQTDTTLEFSISPETETDIWKPITFTSGQIGIDFPVVKLRFTAVTAANVAWYAV